MFMSVCAWCSYAYVFVHYLSTHLVWLTEKSIGYPIMFLFKLVRQIENLIESLTFVIAECSQLQIFRKYDKMTKFGFRKLHTQILWFFFHIMYEVEKCVWAVDTSMHATFEKVAKWYVIINVTFIYWKYS